MMLAFDHLIAIKWPLKHHMLAERSKLHVMVIVFAWIMATVFGVLYNLTMYDMMIQTWTERPTDFYNFCKRWDELIAYRTHSQNDGEKRFVSKIVTTIPLASVVVIGIIPIYCYVAIVAINSVRKRQKAQIRSDNAANPEGLKMRLDQVKGVRATALIITFSLLLWSPTIVYHSSLVPQIDSSDVDPTEKNRGDVFMTGITCCTAIGDAVIYHIVRRKAPLGITKCLRKHVVKERLNPSSF